MMNEIVKTEYYMGFEIVIIAEDLDYEDGGFYAEVYINGDKLVEFDSGIIYDSDEDALIAAQEYIEEIY